MGFESLPMFPLPDIVLFPHSILPLHVFEPRYRALTRDILAGDGLVAIARFKPGGRNDSHGRVPVCDVGGLGQIVEHHAFADGRCNIFVRGVTRVLIEQELPPERPYRMVQIRRLHDEYSGADLGIASSTLQGLAQRLSDVLPEGGETLRNIVRDAVEPGVLADVLAASVVVDPGARQELMETLDVGTRLGRVTYVITELLKRFAKPERTPAN